MIKYAKFINEETGLVEVGVGTNIEYYQSDGMVEMDVEISDVDNNWYTVEKCPHLTPEQIAERERQRLNMLSLTKREVFLALYQSKQITPDMIKAQITSPEALIEFEYANDYFRGNPLINTIGAMLGYSSDDLDYLFEHKEFPPVEEAQE